MKFIETLLAPKTNNRVIVPEPTTKPSLLTGRIPANLDEVKFASRSVSPSEVRDIRNFGYARSLPEGSKYTHGGKDKWWSGADEKGTFGRTWKGGSEKYTIRVPIEKVTPNRAIPARHINILENGKYIPILPGAESTAYTLLKAISRLNPLLAGAELGTVLGNTAYDMVIPYRAENESVIDPKRNDMQRLLDKLKKAYAGTND